jgi:hypothetical protein
VNRIVGEAVGIVRIGMAARDAEDPLAEQVPQRVPDLPGLSGIDQTPGEAIDQIIPTLGGFQQDGAAIGARVRLIERRDERCVEEVRKKNSLWYRVVLHASASVVVKGFICTAFVPRGGVCFSGQFSRFMNYPG